MAQLPVLMVSFSREATGERSVVTQYRYVVEFHASSRPNCVAKHWLIAAGLNSVLPLIVFSWLIFVLQVEASTAAITCLISS